MKEKRKFQIEFIEDVNEFSKDEMNNILGGKKREKCDCKCWIQVNGKEAAADPSS